ncbi:MAG: hypothetical protein IJ436_05880 [Bacteroidaceae bacterium]|nr:hypothetical protein [Bacteroidaceae bacterium]
MEDFFQTFFTLFYNSFNSQQVTKEKKFRLNQRFYSVSQKTCSGNRLPSERNGKLKQNILYRNRKLEKNHHFLVFYSISAIDGQKTAYTAGLFAIFSLFLR